MLKSGIYKITNIINGKIYIGSAINIKKRKTYHLWELNNNKHSNKHLQKSFNKYGETAFKFDTIENCEINDCVKREQFYIDLFISQGVNMYNICLKAGSVLGRKMSEETKKNIGLKNSNKKLSQEQKDHLRRINIGKKLSVNCREKIRKGNLGKKMSEESKIKISIGNKGKPKSQSHKLALRNGQINSTKCGVKIAQYDLNGNLIIIHDKIILAAKFVNSAYGNIFKHLRGERKMVRGFIFKYL